MEKIVMEFLALYGDDYIVTVYRTGLIKFHISMILTTLQLMQSQHFTMPLIYNDTDFDSVLEVVKILIQHAANVFDTLPFETSLPQANK